MDISVMRTAGGTEPADLAIINGRVVNVYTGEMSEGGIATRGDRIAAVGDVAYTIGDDTEIIDAGGKYLVPGFIDGHIHPESSNLAMRPFAQILLQHGTTVVMTDLHEVGVVGGLEAIEAVLDEVADTDLKIYFVVPSHVPFSPDLETSGGLFDPEIIRKALARPDAIGLSECVCTYILSEYDELLESMRDTLDSRLTLHGHLPGMSGPELNKCLASGLSTDHESFSGEDALERLRAGCHVQLREGSIASNLKDCLMPLIDRGLDLSRVSVITDDLDTIDAVERGHLDADVRLLLSLGLGFVDAIRMVTLNPARAFNLDQEIGGLAPGRRADINIVSGPEDFRVEKVIAAGRLVAENGIFLKPYPVVAHKDILTDTMKLRHPVTADSLRITVDDRAKLAQVHVIQTLDWIPVSEERTAVLRVEDGVIQPDLEQDVLYVAQVERYGKNGNIGKAFMGGFHLKRGAIASSVGHDNHNIIVLGTNHPDMVVAVNRVIELGGGQVAVDGGIVLDELAYPILGLLSDLPAEELAERKRRLNGTIANLGSTIPLTFMFLSFMSLAAGGGYAITDHGLIDSANQKIVDPVISLEY